MSRSLLSLRHMRQLCWRKSSFSSTVVLQGMYARREKKLKKKSEATVFFKDLKLPFDSLSSAIDKNGLLSSYEDDIESLTYRMNEKDKSSIKDLIMRRRENIIEEGSYYYCKVLVFLLLACKELKDPKLFLSILYMLQGPEWRTFSVAVLGRFMECMYACGWHDLVKINVREIFGGGKELSQAVLLNLVRDSLDRQDYDFTLELTNNLKGAQEIQKDQEELLLSCLRESLNVKHEETMDKLVRSFLMVFFMDSHDQYGWSMERAQAIREILLVSKKHSFGTCRINYSNGACPNCNSVLLQTNLSEDILQTNMSEDQTRLKLSMYRKIRRLESPHKSIESRHSSAVLKLMRMVEDRNYEVIVDGCNLRIRNEKKFFADIKRMGKKSLVLCKATLIPTVDLTGIDVFYACPHVDDDLYLICAALFCKGNVRVLHAGKLRDKYFVSSDHLNSLLTRWRQVHIVPYVIKQGNLDLEHLGVKVQPKEADFESYQHVLFCKNSKHYCLCIKRL